MKKLLLSVFLSGLLATGVFAQAPSVQVVFDNSSFEPLLAPGTAASIIGQNLAAELLVADGTPWPKELGGVRVLVGDLEAALGFVSPGQLNIQIPVEAQPGEATLVVESGEERSEPFAIVLETHAPGIQSAGGSGTGLGTFLNAMTGAFVDLENPANSDDVISAFATGLGPTDPVVATGEIGAVAPTITTPELRVGCLDSEVVFSGLSGFGVGVYQVNFAVPENTPGGIHGVTLEIGGQTSNEVLLPVSGDEIPAVCSAVSAASFDPDAPAVGGSIMSLFAMNIGEEETLATFPDTEFNDISVTFNSLPAPLFAVVPAARQINVLAPTELPDMGDVEVRITNSVGESTAFSLPLGSASPGIFRVNDPTDPERVFASAVLANTRWLALPDSTAEALNLPINCADDGVDPASFCAQSVAAGDTVTVFLTGLGRATPDGDPDGAVLPTGELAPADANPLYFTVMQPTVTFGDVEGEVSFSGLTPNFAGLYQINVRVPNGAPTGDAVLMTVSMPNGRSDAASVAIRE